MSVFDRDPDRLPERYRVGDVEAINRGLGPGLEILLLERAAVEEVFVLPHPPSVREIILGARAVEGGLALAVDEDHVVALAPPTHGALEDAQVAADVMAAADGVEEKIVIAARARRFLPVLGVEGRRVGGQRGELLVVNVVIERRDGLGALVRNRDFRAAPEGHGPVTIPGSSLR